MSGGSGGGWEYGAITKKVDDQFAGENNGCLQLGAKCRIKGNAWNVPFQLFSH